MRMGLPKKSKTLPRQSKDECEKSIEIQICLLTEPVVVQKDSDDDDTNSSLDIGVVPAKSPSMTSAAFNKRLDELASSFGTRIGRVEAAQRELNSKVNALSIKIGERASVREFVVHIPLKREKNAVNIISDTGCVFCLFFETVGDDQQGTRMASSAG